MEIPDIHWSYSFFSTVILLSDFFIRIGLSLRVIMRKRPYGVSLAWLIVVLLVPFLGGFFYLLVGENRLPERRMARTKASYSMYLDWLEDLSALPTPIWEETNSAYGSLHRQAKTLIGLPAMGGNKLTLITCPSQILGSISRAIDNAQSTCHLQFYIWEAGGRVDEIIASLHRAVARGVVCRILLDSIGSRDFLRSDVARDMIQAGIKIQESLPAGLISAFFSRIDIRNHRKIAVIDGKIAFTGSQNMVDPDVFKKSAGVGNWVDVMVKVEGPVVETLAGTFLSDWFLETSVGYFSENDLKTDMKTIRKVSDLHSCPAVGTSDVQLVPSGPGGTPDAIHSLLLTTIYAAQRELIMTTPYFIPDEPLLAALKAAAQRGVDVKIVVPEKNDSLLVQYASRARYEELAESGVSIYHFSGGLLHSKTITVDGSFSLFGSVNLDMRSFWLNFEATLVIYCKIFTETLYEIQKDYLAESTKLDLERFKQRAPFEKFKENAVLLIAPIL
jgi:cardiolipin synthase